MAGDPEAAAKTPDAWSHQLTALSQHIESVPKAFMESDYSTGIAVALGLVLALLRDRLG